MAKLAKTEVQRFVTSCKAFTDDSSKAGDVSHLQDITERQMPVQYRMPFPEAQFVQPQANKAEAERHLRGIWHELVQHLHDLRYLTETQFVHYHASKKHILENPLLLSPVLNSVKAYLDEEREWPGQDLISPPDGREVDLWWLTKHLSTVVDRIGLHTCWDGSILIPKEYVVGAQTVFGRALAFRLRTLSSTDYLFSETDHYYTGEDKKVLNKFSKKCFPKTGIANDQQIPPEFWEALGDVDSLVSSYVKTIDKRRNLTMLYQLSPEEGEEQTLLQDMVKKDFKLSTKTNWEEHDIAISTQIVNAARRQKKRLDDGLDLRLLQIKLWQAGYYRGAVDGKWEKISHEALTAFLHDKPLNGPVVIARKKERTAKKESEIKKLKANRETKLKSIRAVREESLKKLKGNQAGKKAVRKKATEKIAQLRKKTNQAINSITATANQANKKDIEDLEAARRLRSRHVAVNRKEQVFAADFKEILLHLGVDLEAQAERKSLLDEAALINELPASVGMKQGDFDEKILKEEGLGDLYPNNVAKPKRRISFFRKLGGFIVGGLGKIANWLKKKAAQLADLLGPVFSFIKKLLRPIRTAIHRFFQGFKYLSHFVFGRPLLTETAPATTTKPPRVFATKFQLDFDAINFVPGGFGPEEPGQHASHIQRMQEDMAYFIDGVIWVIKAIGKLTSPGGWVWLGWQIMKSIVGGVPGLGALLPEKGVA